MPGTDSQRLKDLFGDEFEESPIEMTRELLEEEAYRLTHEKFRYYEPNGKCEEFIKEIGEDKRLVVFFSAANGVGKTCVAANVVANILFGKDNKGNKWFDYPIYRDWPYPKMGRIVSQSSNIEKNLIPTLEEWLPFGRYTAKKGTKSFLSKWKTDNGWAFDIMTNEQSPKEFEGPTLGWIWFDEPPTEEIYKACVSRLRKGGIIIITATPLNGSAWMYDVLVAKKDKAATDGQTKTIAHIQAGVEAACKEHGERGHLEHAHIENMIAQYSSEDLQARVYGKFQHLIGLRFKRFSRSIHVVKPFQINDKDFTVYHSLDPHPRTPDAGMWVAVDRKGTWYVVDELWLKCENGTQELATRVKEKNSMYRMERMTIDPSATIEDQHTGKSLVSRLFEYGLQYVAGSKARSQSDKRIEDALAYQQLPNQAEMIKAPEIYIFDTCTQLIWELEHLRWQEWKGKSAEEHGKKQKAMDKDDHLIEALGRILFQEPRFHEMPVYNSVPVEEDNYDPYE